MWINWKRLTCGALLLASLALLLSGCGSMGGSPPPAAVATKTISGVVSDPQTGLPMANAKVTAYAIAPSGAVSAQALSINPTSATSDQGGRYLLKIPAGYSGSVMVEADVTSGSVIKSLARLFSASVPTTIRAAVPQTVIDQPTLPPVMVSFATNIVVEFVNQNNGAAGFSSDNIRRAMAALETFFGPNFAQTPPPGNGTDTGTSKAQQDLLVSITAMNAVISDGSGTNIATIVTAMMSPAGLGNLADSIKSQIVAAVTSLVTGGSIPPEYQTSSAINTAISNAQWSPVVIPDLSDTTAPTVPAGLTASALAPKQVKLTWTAASDSAGVVGYLICRADSSYAYAAIGTLVTAGSTQGTFTYVDVYAAPGTRYSYYVCAFDAARNLSAASDQVNIATPAPVDLIPPSTPGGLICKGTSDTQLLIQWQQSMKANGDGSVVPAAGYYVYRNSQLIATVTETLFKDTTVAPGTSYTYFVKAADTNGNLSAASQALTISTDPPAGATAPQAPGALALASAAACNKVTLSWSASGTAGVTYNVYRDSARVATGITGLAYSDVAVTPSSAYLYTVRAALNGLESNPTAVLPVTTPADPNKTDGTVPAVPGNLSATVGSYTVALSWTASDKVAAGYEIWRSDDSGQSYLKITQVTFPGYIDSTVSPSTSGYVYLVRAFSASGVRSAAVAVGPIQTSAAADLTDTTPPTAPTALTGAADPASGMVSINWQPSTKSNGDQVVAGYLVYRNGAQIADVTSGISFTDSSVLPGTAYVYSVRGYDNSGNLSDYSNVFSVTTPAAADGTYAINGRVTLNGTGLIGVLVTLTDTGTSTSWSVVTDANGYFIFNGRANGTYTLTAAGADALSFTPATRTVFVTGARVTGQDFAAVVTGSLTGIINGGIIYPAGTIIGGITYPTGIVIGGVYYPTATVIGGVTYPTGAVIGGILFPNGVVIGGVRYPAGTVVGGIAFPVGAVTTGYSYPSGTIIGGVVYPAGSVVGNVTYPSGVVVGGVVYPAGVVSLGTTFPTGSAVGVVLYPTGGVNGAFTFPNGIVTGGVVYPSGTVAGGTIYPSGGLTGTLSYPSGSLSAVLGWQ